MIAELFSSLTEALTGFATAFAGTVSQVMRIFWDSTNSQLTDVGALMVISLAIAVVYGIIRWVSRLVHLRG